MHKFSNRKIHNILILLFLSTACFAQVENRRIVPDTLLSARDTLLSAQDTVRIDTLAPVPGGLPISADAVKLPIVYNALDTNHIDFKTQKVYLVNQASAVYGEIDLKAYHIELDMVTGDVHAWGRRDSVGKLIDLPVFKEGDTEYVCEELFYNFNSKKARALNIKTEQEGELHMQSAVTKMHPDGSLHMGGSKISTCDADHPHYYIQLGRAKAFPGEKVISGPAFLVLEDIPLPIALPFGFFPMQQDVSSGLIVPKYGEETNRGLFLKEGGYYFNINDYLDFKVTGDLYTNGTWRVASSSNYRMRYKFSGGFAFSYANNVSGHKNLEDYSKSTNYSLRWNHSQDAKARPGSRFSASVNMSSSGYDKQNSYSVTDHVTTTKSSSISYSKNWAGTPFNFATSLNQSQNSSTQKVSLNLPKASFTMSRIYPLKPKNSAGGKWWQELTVQYTANLDNRINVADSLLFTEEVWNNMKNGFKHDIPISLPINPIKNLTISPQLSYSGVLFTSRINKNWETYYDPVTNDTLSGIIENEESGLFYGHAFRPSISASYSPQIYGFYEFKNPESRVIAVRHVMKPSVSFSYVPVLDGLSTDMYRQVQRDTLGNTIDYSIYEGAIFTTPSLPNRSGSLSFSLSNNIEAKVRSRNDTTGEGEKVKLLDNLSFSTSYNIFADSLKWSPVAMTFRTKLLKEINITARGSFDLYAQTAEGRTINKFLWTTERKPLRLTTFSTSLSFDFKKLIDKFFNNESEPAPSADNESVNKGMTRDEELGGMDLEKGGVMGAETTPGGLDFGAGGYADFSMPWSLKVSYNFNYRKLIDESKITQSATMQGSVTLTKKWAISYTTGYDFQAKEITMTRVGIDRDLHCWNMRFDWIPTGYLKSWNFTIRVKASVLKDLKYERQKGYHDNQGVVN